jgi:hypothetical protein
MENELDNYSDGEVLDWLLDLAGVTTVAELEDILINHSKQEAGTFTYNNMSGFLEKGEK